MQVFGFALARFRSYYDKKMYEMVDALHLGEVYPPPPTFWCCTKPQVSSPLGT